MSSKGALSSRVATRRKENLFQFDRWAFSRLLTQCEHRSGVQKFTSFLDSKFSKLTLLWIMYSRSYHYSDISYTMICSKIFGGYTHFAMVDTSRMPKPIDHTDEPINLFVTRHTHTRILAYVRADCLFVCYRDPLSVEPIFIMITL